MRWKNQRRSTNIEDHRSSNRGASLPIGKRLGASTIILAIGAYLLGADPSTIMNLLLGGSNNGGISSQAQTHKPTAAENELAEFVSVVLADTETTWHSIFQQQLGSRYKEPKLILFNGAINSGCGHAQSAMGPFYCPADQKIYIDLGFYRELRSRHDAPGDFAQAYVIAHEVGHHIQTLLGVSGKVHQAKQQASKVQANQLQVKMELQADCLAGIWALHADKVRNLLERGDIEEALNAARQIGDDTLQRKARGHVIPESFTHGSAQQRSYWFKKGFQSRGDINACDTFSA